jgi:hypothetical protein
MFGAITYAAFPVGILAARDGRRDAIILWALAPWILDFARRIAGLARDEVNTLRETSVRPTGGRRSQLVASLLLVVAVAFAFSPVVLPMVVALMAVLLIAAPLTPTPWRASAWLVASLGVAVVASVVLHAPWSLRFVAGDWWSAFVGVGSPATMASLVDVLSLGVDNVVWRALLVAGYVPVVLMLFVRRGSQSSWITRAFLLVVVSLALRMATEHDLVALALPEPLVLASLTALGVSMSATAAFAVFIEGRSRTFTWQQLLATVSVTAMVAAAVPSAVVVADGRWMQPNATLSQLVTQLPDDADGDYATLYIGDTRLLPVAAVAASDGRTAFGVVRDGGATGVDLVPSTPTQMSDALVRAVDVLLTGESLRAGRLMAPLAVRFIVVPLRDDTLHARREPTVGSVGGTVVARLSDQLDLRRVYSATDLVIFENMAALPTVSVLDERAAVASKQALEANLLAEQLRERGNFATSFSPDQRMQGESLPGTVHLAVPFTSRWTMTVDGARVAPRVAFGATTAFDAPVAGISEIRLRASVAIRALIVLQLALWCVVLAVAFNPSRFRGRVRAAREVVEVSLRSDDERKVVV